MPHTDDAKLPKYIPVTTGGTPALSQSRSTNGSESHVFTLADWLGDGYDPERVRFVHVQATVEYQTTTGSGTVTNVEAVFPDGSVLVIAQIEKVSGLSAFSSPTTVMVAVPVNDGQTTFELRLNCGTTSSTAVASFTIVGVTQN